MKEIKTEDAIGSVLCHDITEIVKDQRKGPRFKKGHIIKEEDIEVLLNLGKEHLYVFEKDETMIRMSYFKNASLLRYEVEDRVYFDLYILVIQHRQTEKEKKLMIIW